MQQKDRSEIMIETLVPLRVACYAVASATPENDAARYMEAWLAARHLDNKARHFGFDIGVTPEQTAAGMRGYEVWRVVPEGVEAADGVVIRKFPGGPYAVMTLYHPFDAPFEIIPAGWQVLHEWVISSTAYRSGDHQWLEELLPADVTGDPSAQLKLYHPIAAATEIA